MVTKCKQYKKVHSESEPLSTPVPFQLLYEYMCLFVSGTFLQRSVDGFLPTATGSDKVSSSHEGSWAGRGPWASAISLKAPGTCPFGRFWAPFLPLRDFRL